MESYQMGDTAHMLRYQRGKPWPVCPGGVDAAVLLLSPSLLGLTTAQRKGFNY